MFSRLDQRGKLKYCAIVLNGRGRKILHNSNSIIGVLRNRIDRLGAAEVLNTPLSPRNGTEAKISLGYNSGRSVKGRFPVVVPSLRRVDR
jgi:hypothetical protein